MKCRKNKKKRLMNESGVLSYVFIFGFFAIVLLFAFAILVPLLMNMNTRFYQSGEYLIDDGAGVAAKITDANMQAQLGAIFTSSKNAVSTNMDILGFFFQYSWAIIIIMLLLGIFLVARRQVEISGGYGGYG